MQTAIQLYTLREIDGSILDVLARVGDAGFDGVEFAYRVDEASTAEIREALEDAGLTAVAAHVGIETLEADLDGVIETAEALGYEDIVVPWLDPEHFETVAAVEATAERLSELARAVADRGLQLHYHNHDQEFAETDEGVAFDLLVERSSDDLMFEVDAGWALYGGADPVALLHEYADRISLVHFKDVRLDSEDAPPLGEGDLDVDAVATAAREIDAEWAVFENDEPDDPVTALANGADVLSGAVR
ncbi:MULTISPECIES: sugar phosphate isomerase/epimerase family protein [Halomicrobium]|uniref:Xylose isomerase domain protein TIM barrel n=2 Tax=Halomicrobium mukohataei TaxID=57705 RepID=C7P3I6_HALMD|nr:MULTISPECIES: sugar phosphate isomerase/epimerase [Halomicrobium]ACV47658.1 Xylose isomerase domain protein TIM barrel [Halomicrobium mukohataei DSM 12286]QCD66113.1 sugar phosphate isomerase/epimerase [Halomicrobium mukohataei]QFR20918.1 TIM barrel protein [Halomicrobium sp. ZPS1]